MGIGSKMAIEEFRSKVKRNENEFLFFFYFKKKCE